MLYFIETVVDWKVAGVLLFALVMAVSYVHSWLQSRKSTSTSRQKPESL